VNYLVHLYLAGDQPGHLLGALMGDFVKGPIPEHYQGSLREGLILHRRLDAFCVGQADCRRSRLRLDPSFGHLRSVMVDIFYDHLLARHWHHHHPLPLTKYAAHIYRLVEKNAERLPAPMRPVMERMVSMDWLSSYARLATVETVLQRISKRLSRPNRLGEGLSELTDNYLALANDYRKFLFAARKQVRIPQAIPGDF